MDIMIGPVHGGGQLSLGVHGGHTICDARMGVSRGANSGISLSKAHRAQV